MPVDIDEVVTELEPDRGDADAPRSDAERAERFARLVDRVAEAVMQRLRDLPRGD